MSTTNSPSLLLRSCREYIFTDPGYHVWCSSVVPWKGKWWLFYSRWPEIEGFEAWATHSEIALASGPTPFGPFEPLNHVILPHSGSHHWERDVAHNPTVVIHQNQFILAYMANFGPLKSTRSKSPQPNTRKEGWWTHRNNQRIGIVSSRDPLGTWTTSPQPHIDVEPQSWDALVTNNPTLIQRPDGKWVMIYKGVTQGSPPFGGNVLHGVAESNLPTGPYTKIPNVHPFGAEGVKFPAEDPFAWWDQKKQIYRAIVKDNDGSLTGVDRSLAFYTSKDALVWDKTAGPHILGPSIQWEDDTIESFTSMERPQITFDSNRNPVALQLACRRDDPHSASFSVSVPLPENF